MGPKILTEAEIEQFIADGYVLLRDAFPADVARAAREVLFREMGVDLHNPASWEKQFIHLQKTFTEPPFTDAITERVHAACDDLLGAGRYHPMKSQGWWPVSFPGFEPPPWTPPTDGWHVDGIQFHHHIDSPTQGLLPIFIYSDIGPGDGGTAVDVGSHRVTARELRDAEPAGLDVFELTRRVVARPRGQVLEMQGRAGDVALLHPFMLHARSPNTGSSVRFICNPCVSFKEKMDLSNGGKSPVERAIVEAVGE